MRHNEAMGKQEEFVLRALEERDVRFVRLWFTDVQGALKSVAIAPAELEGAFEEGIGFDGSAVEGFARVQEADMLAVPDPTTFQILPWRGEGPATARMFCDIQMPDKPWLLPGIMAQTIAFSAFIVAIGLNTDIGKGMVDRLRSLPIRRSSILISRSIAALIHSSIGVAVMSVTGLFIGWRLHDGVVNALIGYGLLLLFGFAMIWVGILVGSAMRSVEAVNGLMFTTIFPITFLSNAFARTDVMPAWLRTIAEWNPISSLSQAMRDNWGVAGQPLRADAPWPLHHPELATIIWSVGITLVIAPLALRAFNARTTD